MKSSLINKKKFSKKGLTSISLDVKIKLKVEVKFNSKGGGWMDDKRVDVASKLVIGDLREMLVVLLNKVAKAHDLVSEQLDRADSIDDDELIKSLEYTIALLADIRSSGLDIAKYLKRIILNYRVEDSRYDSLEDTLNSLSNKIDLIYRKSIVLAKNDGVLNEKINNLENLLNNNNVLSAGNSRIDELLDVLDRNVKSLAVSEYMKSDKFKENSKRTGEMSNRFNHKVDSDELIRLYEANEYKLTNDIVDYFNAKGANITYNGLRKRLITIGVWKGNQK